MPAPLQHLLEAYAAALDRTEQQYLETRVALAGLDPAVRVETSEIEAEDESLGDEDAPLPPPHPGGEQ